MKEFIKKLYNWSLFRFALVGAVNTLVGAGVMFALYNLAHCSYWLSSAANYVVGSVLSYFLNKYFTFKSREKSPHEVLLFALNIAVCYLAAYGAAKPMMLQLLADASPALRDNVAMLVGMVLFTLLNYLGQRLLVFRKKSK